MKIKNFEILNSKAIKELVKLLQQQWGYDAKLECGFLQKENDIFLITKDVDKIALGELNVNSLGLYFAELRHEQLRLSIEGSQIIGKTAKKNVLEISDAQMRQWLKGENLDAPDGSSTCDDNAYLIIKHDTDFFGCGRIKDGKLLNFVPKARRLSA